MTPSNTRKRVSTGAPRMEPRRESRRLAQAGCASRPAGDARAGARHPAASAARPLAGVVACLALLLLAPAALAEDILVRVASGQPGGTYRDVYARNLEQEMRGFGFVYLKTRGSGENLEILADGDAELAFAQADVYAARSAADPERFGNLMVLGRLADECVFIAHRKDGRVAQFGQLGAAGEEPAKLGVGSPDSGMAGSWSWMVTLEPGLKTARLDYTEGTLAINQLAVGMFDAVGFVTDPTNLDHKLLRAVGANDALELMPITDPFLFTPMSDGTEVYRARSVKLGRGFGAPKLDTICTSALVLTRKDVNRRILTKVSDLISLERDRIVRPPGSKR